MALWTFPLLFALAFPFQAPDAKISPPPQTLAAMRDKYRPLLIFARHGDPRLAQQTQMLTAHRAELIERQVMLVPCCRKHAGGWDQEIETFLVREEDSLRRRFRIPGDEFTVLLIGKDGGEKFRSHTPVTIDQLNQIIDAMPMRRHEQSSNI